MRNDFPSLRFDRVFCAVVGAVGLWMIVFGILIGG